MNTTNARLKQRFSILLAALLLCAALLAACGGDAGPGVGDANEPPAASLPLPQPVSPISSIPLSNDEPSGESSSLFVLCSDTKPNISSEEGFYQVEYVQHDTYPNRMFYNYQTQQQEYFCSAPGCQHNDESCTSFIGDFPSNYAFAYGDYLYVAYQSYYSGGPDDRDPDAYPSALVRYNRDGTNPTVLLTLGNYEMQISTVFCDEKALYIPTEFGFAQIDLESLAVTWLSADIGLSRTDDNGNFCSVLPILYDGEVLFTRAKYEGTRRGESSLYSFNIYTGHETLLHTFAAGGPFISAYGEDGIGYYIDWPTGEVRSLNIATGEDALVTDMLSQYNTSELREYEQEDPQNPGSRMVVEETYYAASAWGVKHFGDWLILDTWVLPGPQDTPVTATYGYNVATGEETQISFGNYFNGYEHPMMIWGETPYGLLVTEETRAIMVNSTGTGGAPYTFESAYDVYALISLDDFVHSRSSFRTITPVPYTDPL